jgi:hypothetical protein
MKILYIEFTLTDEQTFKAIISAPINTFDLKSVYTQYSFNRIQIMKPLFNDITVLNLLYLN